MSGKVITLSNNLLPPVVCSKTAKEIYELVETTEFDVEKFNSLLLAVVTYLDVHKVKYGDKALPWAENVNET